MKPVRLPAAATLALPRWALFALGLLYILPGLIGRDPWKDDAASFGIMWTMAHGTWQRLAVPEHRRPAIARRRPAGLLAGRAVHQAVRLAAGRRAGGARLDHRHLRAGHAVAVVHRVPPGPARRAQPLRLAFGGQPEADDYGRTLADTAVLIYLGCLGLLLHSHETLAVTLQGSLLAWFLYRAVRYVENAVACATPCWSAWRWAR
jgi:hypothetical protein